MKELDGLKEYIVSQLEEGNFFEVIEEINFSTRNAGDELGSVLASLHNEGKVNFVSYYEGLQRDSVSVDFFTLKILFEKALPALVAPVNQIMDVALNLYLESKGDLLANNIFSPLEQFLIKDKRNPRVALEQVLSDHEKYLPLIPTTLKAGCEVDLVSFYSEILSLCKSSNMELKKQAIYTLGMINYEQSPELLSDALDLVINTNISDIELTPVAIVAGINLFNHDDGSEQKFERFAEKVFESPNQELIYVAADLLWRNKERLTDKLKNIFVVSLRSVDTELNSVNIIDYVLNDFLNQGNVENAIETAEAIICSSGKPNTITKFNSFSHSLLKNQQALGSTVIKWLNSNQSSLWRAAFDLIGVLDEPKITLQDKDFLFFGDLDFVFLGRKVVGLFYHKEVFATEFLLQIMEYCLSEEVLQVLAELMYEILLKSYSSVGDVLEKYHSEREEINAIFDELIQKIKSYHKGLGDVPFKEMQAPLSWKEAFYLKRQKEQEIANKKAQEQSVFLSLVSKQVLLYGRKTIFYIDSGGGKLHRQESPLSTFSHSFEIPRLSFVDPHNLDLRLRTFRNEVRKL